jgi:hypothetical protein
MAQEEESIRVAREVMLAFLINSQNVEGIWCFLQTVPTRDVLGIQIKYEDVYYNPIV